MDAMRDAAIMQEEYQRLVDEKRLSKKAMCALCVPFRDKYGLTDLQTLRIARKEMGLMEMVDLLQPIDTDVFKVLLLTAGRWFTKTQSLILSSRQSPLLSRAESAESAQETLQRAVAEYKARAEKAEMDRDELFKLLDDTCKDVRERHVDDSVCGLCEYDGVHSSESGDCVNECPGFDMDDCFCMKKSIREKYGQKEE